MSTRSAAVAAVETSGIGLRFLMLCVVGVFLFSSVSDFQRWREARAPIYAEPENIIWAMRPDALVVSAVTSKLEDCSVPYGSHVFLLAMAQHNGDLEPLSYPAIKMSGKEMQGRPLLKAGDRFVVGPWVIKDSREMLARIQEVRVILQCEFESGVRRSTFIGPIRKPGA